MGLQLMNLHKVMGNVWLSESCSQMGKSLTSDKSTDRRSKESVCERESVASEKAERSPT